MGHPEAFREPFALIGGPAADWLSTLRAYVDEDWLTTGIAEYLDAQAEAARAAHRMPCLGCGHCFPRGDVWIHVRFDDVAYCDACYYRRFGRQAACHTPKNVQAFGSSRTTEPSNCRTVERS
jgi:hypothetical protein